MDGNGERSRAAREPCGLLPRTGATGPALRRAWDWVFGDRADVDQEGLLAERTLRVRPHRAAREEPAADRAPATGSPRDEARV
jgi:hypothetical protein